MRRALAYSGAVVGLAVIALVSTAATSVGASAPRSNERGTSVGASGSAPVVHHQPAGAVHCRHARSAVPFYRQRTWEIQALHLDDRADRTPIVKGKRCAWARYAAAEWVARSRSAARSYQRHLQVRQHEQRSLYEKWRCIHEHEGAWNAINPAGYYGGLQMDVSFQRAYGSEFMARWGYAHRWPVWAQLTAAERAYAVRGFGPWPTYYRYCA